MQTRFASISFAVAAAALFAQGGAHAAMAVANKATPPSASASGPDALAQESAPTVPGTPQRSKMKACNADAKVKELHGDERRKFMSHCLSGKASPHS